MNPEHAEMTGSANSHQSKSLLGPSKLLAETFSIYRNRFGTIIGILVLPIVLIVVSVALLIVAVLQHTILFAVLGLVLIIFCIFVSLWSAAALGCAIRDRAEKIGIKESYRRGRSIIGALFWVSFLTGLLVVGGSILLIIPGIMMAVWFSLSSVVLIVEGDRGMNALMKSREYVRGMGWKVFWRFVVIQLVLIIVSIVCGFIFGSSSTGSSMRSVVSFLLSPLVVIYSFLIYENLRAIKGTVVAKGKKSLYVLAGVIGFILIPVIIIGMLIVNR